MSSRGIVAIVGRPNVGKSTLFNQLTRSRSAIVDDRPGVTRDRLYGVVKTMDAELTSFALIDTGGFETDDSTYQPFSENIVWRNTTAAIDEADLVLLVLDGKDGLHPHDEDLARMLKKKGKQWVAVVNKIDDVSHETNATEFYSLGIDDYETMSAAHNRGVDAVCERLVEELKKSPRLQGAKPYDERALRIAVVGRPNAGKSSIVNRLLKSERSLVSDVAGTTRDALDTPFRYNEQDYLLIDTAGIRRRSKVSDKVEIISVIQSMEAIDRAHIVVLVISAIDGITDQDLRIATMATERQKPVILVYNKWDLVPDKNSNSSSEIVKDLRFKYKSLDFAPVLFISCLQNQRVHSVMATIERIGNQYRHRESTSNINKALRTMVLSHTPALMNRSNKRVKFYFATQVRSCPPTIVVMCNVAEEIAESYKRYMQRQFQEALGFTEVPIRLAFRGKDVRNNMRSTESDVDSVDEFTESAADAGDFEEFEVDSHGSEMHV